MLITSVVIEKIEISNSQSLKFDGVVSILQNRKMEYYTNV